MFRNPRFVGPAEGDKPPLPSTGRPPTPPSDQISPNMTTIAPRIANIPSVLPLTGTTRPSPKSARTAANGKGKEKVNGSILNFFKRSDSVNSKISPVANPNESLFLESSPTKASDAHAAEASPINEPKGPFNEAPTPCPDTLDEEYQSVARYNEVEAPSKKRRIEAKSREIEPNQPSIKKNSCAPFLDDSDDEDFQPPPAYEPENAKAVEQDPLASHGQVTPPQPCETDKKNETNKILHLKREATSVIEVDDFAGVEDFIDDEFPEDGEEFMERRWMEEQAQLELGLGEEDDDEPGNLNERESIVKSNQKVNGDAFSHPNGDKPSCPICGGDTSGLSEQVRMMFKI